MVLLQISKILHKQFSDEPPGNFTLAQRPLPNIYVPRAFSKTSKPPHNYEIGCLKQAITTVKFANIINSSFITK